MDLHETLLSYSFWLSDQEVLTPANRNDPRTHDQLVQEFLTQLAASTKL